MFAGAPPPAFLRLRSPWAIFSPQAALSPETFFAGSTVELKPVAPQAGPRRPDSEPGGLPAPCGAVLSPTPAASVLVATYHNLIQPENSQFTGSSIKCNFKFKLHTSFTESSSSVRWARPGPSGVRVTRAMITRVVLLLMPSTSANLYEQCVVD